MDDLLNEFLTETGESIDVVDVELVKLEQDPNNKAVLDNIFRLVHTIKGTCGFLGLPRLEAVAHSGENILGKFRDGALDVTPQMVSLILEALDRIKSILADLEANQAEPDGDDSELIARLDAAAAGRAPAAAAPPPPKKAAKPEAAKAPDAAPEERFDPGLNRPLKEGEVSLAELEAAFNAAAGPEEAAQPEGKSALDKLGGEDLIVVAANTIFNKSRSDGELGLIFSSSKVNHIKKQVRDLLVAVLRDEADATAIAAAKLADGRGLSQAAFDRFIAIVKVSFEEIGSDAEAIGEAVMMLQAAAPAVVREEKGRHAEVSVREDNSGERAVGEGGRSSQSIRVSVDLLEDLMNLVSELVLTRNQLLQMVRRMEDSEFAVPLQRLSQCTTELQEGVMKTRMQPIGNAWAKLPRVVRDLSIELNKKIELDMRGAETELDRQVLELIKDPLTHMVRNSADHGIEEPHERVARGKPETGTVRLNAYHEGGHIIIVVSDDGRGINTERLKVKIVENGLASEADVENMSEAQIQKFIFHAGLSTAQKVTSVSGRGVGMDVVRSNIEKIGGTIDLVSNQGKGSTFYIKIPLTLAIVSALIVQAKTERFAIPQISVLELVRASADSEHRIEHINETPVLRLRNRLLPLIYLRDILKFERDQKAIDNFIVVTQVGTFTFGIVVDAVYDTEEIVVKPVAPILKEISVYSGNTILGDGSVIMILDPNGVANTVSTTLVENDQDSEEAAFTRAGAAEKESMLLFRAGSANPKAVPLSLVARLEEIKLVDIEHADGRPMVQYRGALMPLLTVDGLGKFKTDAAQPVLVFSDGDKTMGLAVDEILDIVEDRLSIELGSETKGMVGTAVINKKVTEVIDVAHYLNLAFNDWLRADANPSRRNSRKGDQAKVLVIDDSAFFRNMLKPLLTAAGYRVTTASDAEEALRMRENGDKFDLIVSDVEMPGLSGFDFAEEVKSGGGWQSTPLIALSGLASEADFARGRQVGFNDYVAKLDREALLESMAQQLSMPSHAA